jgi:hypothetical protein
MRFALCTLPAILYPQSSIFDLHCSVLSTRYSALFDLSGLGSAKARNRLGGEAAVIEGTDVAGTQTKQVKTELDTRPTGIGVATN